MNVSVIVPIYGIERYLPDCVESLLAQTLKDIEIILVNDGSLDGCPEICDYYSAVDKRIKVVHKTNGGLVSARKAGLSVATGEYIGYVDGDDWIEPEMFRHMYIVAKNTNADIVAAGFKKDIEGRCTAHINAIKPGIYPHEEIRDIISNVIFYDGYFMPGIYTYVWNKLFKREILQEAQNSVPDNLTLGEDAACTYSAIYKAQHLTVIDATHYHYRQRTMSMLKSAKNKSKSIEKVRLLYDYLNHLVKKWDTNSNRVLFQIDRYILYMLTAITGGAYRDNNKVFPYLFDISEDEWKKSRRVALYGAGTLGQHLYSLLCDDPLHDVIHWSDPDYLEYKAHHLLVDSVESIVEEKFDILMIVTVGAREADRVKSRLSMLGIDGEKIIMPNFLGIDIDKVLHETYGIGQAGIMSNNIL